MNGKTLSVENVISNQGGVTSPDSWDSIYLSYVLDEISETVPVESTTHLTPSSVHGVVPQDELENTPQKALRDGYELTPARPGDFIITMSSYENGLEFCDISGGISPDYTVLRPRVSDNRTGFLKYLFKSKPFIEILSLLSTGIRQGKRIYWSDLKSVQVKLPEDDEAKEISEYLDAETSKINSLVNSYREFSELLSERVDSRISHTMRKGISGRNTVPCEIDWLRGKPEGWEVRKLKYCCERIVDAINNTAPTTDDGFAYMIRTTQIRNGDLDLSEADMVDEDTYYKWNRRETPQGGDLVFTREAPMGEACIIPDDKDVILGQRMMLVRPDNSVILNRYLLLWFYSEMAKYQYELEARGSTVEHLRVKDVPNLQVPVPPLAEQKEIVELLWSERDLAKTMSANIQASTSLLEEKRQSLITNVVTGQIDVEESQRNEQETTL